MSRSAVFIMSDAAAAVDELRVRAAEYGDAGEAFLAAIRRELANVSLPEDEASSSPIVTTEQPRPVRPKARSPSSCRPRRP